MERPARTRSNLAPSCSIAARRSGSDPVRVVAPPAPKEIPFVMEIISGPNKREQKFGVTPEVK